MKKKVLQIFRLVGIIFIWLFVFIAALLPARYINYIYGYLALLFLIFMILISILFMVLMRYGISVESDFKDVECERGNAITLALNVVNRSFLLCPGASADFYISDLFGNDDASTKTYFTLAPREKNDFGFDLDMKHIGIYHAGLKNIQVWDLLGLFTMTVPVQADFKVHVGPKIHEIQDLDVSEEVLSDSQRDTNRSAGSGMDYVGVREYEMGDSMKKIHWKLSAHSLGYMTKINESSRQSDFVVMIDFAAPSYEREELMDVNDCLIETAFSVIEYLSHQEVAYSLVFCDRDQEMHRVVPTGGGNYLEIIKQFAVITPNPDVSYPDAAKLLIDESRMPNRSANVILCTSRVTEEMIQEMLRVKQQQRFPRLYLVLPERLNERERENVMAPLRQFDEAGIAYTVINTQINRKLYEGGSEA